MSTPSTPSTPPGVEPDPVLARFEAATARLPVRVRGTVEHLLAQWPGRVLVQVASTTARIELFDRSMSIAAQFFTSVFPVLIVIVSWLGAGGNEVADALSMPAQTEELLEDALDTTSGSATFGVLGGLIVLLSATSLARALTRAFAALWELPRPRVNLTSAWRWVAVVLALALALMAARGLGRYVADIPPPALWELAALSAFDVAIGLFVPWLLMAGQVPARRVLPGAVLFAVTMVLVRPASGVWLPRALEASADRYGAIGIAFTYLAWLYVVSFCFLASHLLGKVLTTDPGWLGQRIRGRSPTPTPT